MVSSSWHMPVTSFLEPFNYLLRTHLCCGGIIGQYNTKLSQGSNTSTITDSILI